MKDFITEARDKTGGSVSPRDAEGANALILDVREAEELASTGRVAGALHIPRGLLEAKADPSSPAQAAELTGALAANRPVNVLCASGARAALAAARLVEMGYTAKPIEGGIKAWQDAGLPIAKGGSA
ncbi:sulfurtransferase [Jiella sp. CQZ9-1]|uniref:Sulfurtransferase n=2 Tax=Jiella flava TaxID=2816857 RepID=A0A939JW91_9HYPH|nr:sulfurtransferase [Jiella flava]